MGGVIKCFYIKQGKNKSPHNIQMSGKGIQIFGVKFIYDATNPSYIPAVLNTDKTIKTPEVLG